MGARIGPEVIGEKRVGRRAEQKRRWDREAKHPCETAGCKNLVGFKSTRCQDCRTAAEHKARDLRFGEIQRRWLLGESLREIAGALNSTVGSVEKSIFMMRRCGWHVPYRHNYPHG